MPGMPGMPGMGGAGGGGGLNWSETAQPVELTMTYDEFILKAGVKRANIPPAYLTGADSKPAKRTTNAWWQIHRIYASDEAEKKPLTGQPGGRLEKAMARELAAKANEVEMVKRVYSKYATNLFTFEMSAPHPKEVSLSALESGGFTCLVAMRVNEAALRRLLAGIQREFSQYSHLGNYPGLGRKAYRLVTWEHGVWNPKFYWLSNEALDEWDRLWAQSQVRVRAYGTDGSVIAESKLSLGHTGTTPSDLLYPPDFPREVRTEKWALGLPGAKQGFDGGPGIRWQELRGWLYVWSVSGPIATVSQVDVGEAAYLGADGVVGKTMQFGHPVDPKVKLTAASPDRTPLGASLSQITSAQQFIDSLWGGPASGGGGGAAGGMGGAGGMPGMGGGMGGPGGMPGMGGMGGPGGMPGMGGPGGMPAMGGMGGPGGPGGPGGGTPGMMPGGRPGG